MTLLLDIHALLWFCLDDPKLSPTARRSIPSMENKVLVSPASLWEIAIEIGNEPCYYAALHKPWQRRLWKHSAVKELRRLSKRLLAKIVGATEELAKNPFPAGSRKIIGAKHTHGIRIGDYFVYFPLGFINESSFRSG
uniref:PIN domain nuclease, a component of toxin-antitoxin system (PIN domain) n=1 Tax=Candidatus Kentrum sp. TC TaxID=2126339 RepID=A0A450YQW3_9GAMM|nr:MAG: PIN domain nuclease, a component of toxin-antitoxin system (PIN domain) [Candidatus Kentron sp. TC]